MTKKIGLLKIELERPDSDVETTYILHSYDEYNPEYASENVHGRFPNCYIHNIEFIPILD